MVGETSQRLQADMTTSFQNALAASPLLNEVFPPNGLQIYPGGIEESIPTAKRLQRDSGLPAKDAQTLYAASRNRTALTIKQRLDEALQSPPQLAPEIIETSFNEAVRSLCDQVQAGATVIRTHIPLSSTWRWLRWYVGMADDAYIVADAEPQDIVDQEVQKINILLSTFLRNPPAYLSERVYCCLTEQAKLDGEASAKSIVSAIVSDGLKTMRSELEHIVTNAQTKSAASLFPSPAPAVKQSIYPAASPRAETKASQSTPEHTEGFMTFSSIKLHLPWLEEASERDLQRYTTEDGRHVLFVDSRTASAAAIADGIVSKNPAEAAIFETHVKRIANYIASGSKRYKMLRTNKNPLRVPYVGRHIYYYGTQRENAQRTYFCEAPLRDIVDESNLKKLLARTPFIAPDDTVILLLGQCNKATQINMLQLFLEAGRTELRRDKVGSI